MRTAASFTWHVRENFSPSEPKRQKILTRRKETRAMQESQSEPMTAQIAALLRTYLLENKPIDQRTIHTYLHEVAGLSSVSEEEVERAVQSLFEQLDHRGLHSLPFSGALVFSNIIYGIYDDDYSFVTVRMWTSGTLCYVLYALTREKNLPAQMIFICQKPDAVLTKLRSLHLCPDYWRPLAPSSGYTFIGTEKLELEKLLTTRVALLKEIGPLHVYES